MMMKDDDLHSIQSVLSVLGEVHLLETYFEGFDKTLSILLAGEDVTQITDATKIFNLHSDVECVKSDIHSITKKLLIIASELSAMKIDETRKETQPTASIKIKKMNPQPEPDPEQPRNVWLQNASEYISKKYENIETDDDGE
jgi:hypothetical protein